MGQICRHCLVKGRVQGVFFRVSTQKKARELGLKGWVRNTADGHVEVQVCGQVMAVEQLCIWLRQGPPAADVDNVSVSEVMADDCAGEYSGFGIRS